MKYISKLNNKSSNKYQYIVKWVFVFMIIISPTIFYFETAHAGLSSFISTLVKGEKVSAKATMVSGQNSQTIPLPIVAVNIDPNPDKKFEVIPVIDGKTLISDLASINAPSEYSSKISVYTVNEGDTVASIAKMFNVSVNTILWANDMNSKSVLKVGQNLTILPVTGIKYIVEKNDTVLKIANKYRADVDEIYNYNDIDQKSKLTVGQVVIIPDVEIGISSPNRVVKALNGMIVPEDPLLVNVKKLPSYSGYYSCPVIGTLTQGLHGRNSVDLGAPIGTAITASASGTVTISKSEGWNGGYGNFVVISHGNGTQTLYGHMLRNVVGSGDNVNKGQVIGYVGVSGMTTGPHVHFEVRGAQNPFATQDCD
jgi:LysM repeat protein